MSVHVALQDMRHDDLSTGQTSRQNGGWTAIEGVQLPGSHAAKLGIGSDTVMHPRTPLQFRSRG
jgi:hypothetical protein